jgi:hypothetical protein
LRNFISPILIFEDKEAYKVAINDTTFDVLMFHISQPELMTQLKDHLIIECNLTAEVDSKRYERIKKFIFSKYLKDTQHPIKDLKILCHLKLLNKIDLEAQVLSVERYLEKTDK